VWRFVVSYAIVVPVAAAVLAHAGRLRRDRLVTTVGTAWAIKLVVTALLYLAFARGTASIVQATAPVASSAPTARPAEYTPALGAFRQGSLAGRITRNGVAVPGAAVIVDAPPPGAGLGEPTTIRMSVGADAAPVVVAHVSDEIFAVGQGGGSLHTVRVTAEGRFSSNTPVPPQGGAVPVRVPGPGIYDVTCATHAAEHQWLVVVDHPYAVLTDEAGRFRLDAVVAGVRQLTIVAPGDVVRRAVDVAADEQLSLDIAIPAAQEDMTR
jgi:hypothetical protein